MNSIIRLGVSVSLAAFVCRERDGIALGREGGRRTEGLWERKRGDRIGGLRSEGKKEGRKKGTAM